MTGARQHAPRPPRRLEPFTSQGTPLTTDVVLELLATTDVPQLVREVRALAVSFRARPRSFTTAEGRLIADLVRLKPTDEPPTGVPASAVPALMATIGRERPDLGSEQVAAEARRAFHAALRERAAALGRAVVAR